MTRNSRHLVQATNGRSYPDSRQPTTAARAERNGDSISDKTLEAITKVNNQIATIERELGQREEERLDMQRDYQLERLMFESNSCDVEVSVAASD